MEAQLVLISPAKLNLFLHITGRRPDGYHELQTYFQLLDFGDTMRFRSIRESSLTLTPSLPDVPHDNNLIVRAARLLQQHTKTTHGAHIDIEKHIPMGAGLGGGSSNAATTLLALNHLWQTGLNETELLQLGLTLGADVPVFIKGHSAFAEGVGERLTSMNFKHFWFVVLKPDCSVSTAQIFSDQRLTRNTPAMRIAPASEGQPNSPDVQNPIHDWLSDQYRNDCEICVSGLYPQIRETLDWLHQNAKNGQARLTGTGACCFSWTESLEEAQELLNKADSRFNGFIAKGVDLSPAHQRLHEAR